jgi:hypothetical protein
MMCASLTTRDAVAQLGEDIATVNGPATCTVAIDVVRVTKRDFVGNEYEELPGQAD